MLKEMKLAGLIMDSTTNAPVIVLKDLEDKEVISIWIGLLEASAIAVELEKIDLPRPMTHDLVKNVFNSLNIKVLKVEIADLRDNTFYAYIHLGMDGKTFTIDARPSDAIAIALRTKSPIYVDEDVIKKSKKMDLESIKEVGKTDGSKELKDLLERMSPDDFEYKM
ncbi:MAG: bifunctional nuclease family protein [Deltaproteobacteria bacterium]|nr:bifunctional nuclease family protein [Deltaproteobacteria bacterium]MBW2652782.1 bifunctional nuclease family protein [Deltaproteobacteria bacterium]NOQ85560.1 bifunctional nuclease family protein [Deltaproteobacteria bacterium]